MLLNRGGESHKNKITLHRLVTWVRPVAMSWRPQTKCLWMEEYLGEPVGKLVDAESGNVCKFDAVE